MKQKGYRDASSDQHKYLKVCLLTTVHLPFDTRIFHKQARTLRQVGYDVTLLAQHDKNEVVDGIKIIALPEPKNRLQRMLYLTWRVFHLALYHKADIYHFHDPELLPIGVLLKLFTQAKVIYDVHENVRKQILNKFWLPIWSRKFFSMVYVLIERLCLPFIDRVIIAEDSYIENYKTRRNIIAVRNYPILSYLEHYYQIGTENQKQTYSFHVIYIGGISKLRGAVELIEALNFLKTIGYSEVVLHLVGPVFPPTFKGTLDTLIRQYGFQEKVLIPGKVTYEKVFSLMAQANVGVAILHPDPNYIESLPTKLFEYMSAGLPVIASNFPLWKEIVEGNKCGICVDPLKPEEIARAIEYLLTHPEEARRMGENGRKAVLEKYNWEKESEKLVSLYKELLR